MDIPLEKSFTLKSGSTSFLNRNNSKGKLNEENVIKNDSNYNMNMNMNKNLNYSPKKAEKNSLIEISPPEQISDYSNGDTDNTTKSSSSSTKHFFKGAILDKKDEEKEEYNDYDKFRIENMSSMDDPSFLTIRKFNTVLYQKFLNGLSKIKQIRNIDIIPTKIQSFITNYAMLSSQGNHQTFGEKINVNQDVFFCYENFLLLRNLYFFGVCDGHGDLGHLVSEHAKIYLPLNIQYIEIDNNVTKRGKTIDKLMSSLYSIAENQNVKEMDIVKYLYDKFSVNINDISFYKKSFNEINVVLKEAFKCTQEALEKGEFDSNSSGSTVCSLVLNGKHVYCSNVGDSRAILCSTNDNSHWRVSQLTKDHKPTEKEERARILKCKGKVERCSNEEHTKEIGPYRVWFIEDSKGPGLAMSRSLGDTYAKEIGVIAEPDVFEYCLNQSDKFIIIASDGVWEYITNYDALEIIKPIFLDKKKNPNDACVALTKIATQRWKKVFDYITFSH